MDPAAPDGALRVTLGLSALGGGAVYGVYHLATTLLAGQPPSSRDLILAAVNVACATVVGGLVAYFLGPVMGPFIPMEGLREPHALGFGIGALAWEVLPIAFRGAKKFASTKLGGDAP